MRLIKAMAVTGLAATLTVFGQAAFAQTGSFSANPPSYSASSSYGDTSNYGYGDTSNYGGNSEYGGDSNFNSNPQGSWWSGRSRSTAWDLDRGVREDISRAAAQGEDVTDAEFFEQQGRMALQNGYRSRALADFRAAEECLGSSGTIGVVVIYPESSQSGNQGQSGANQGASSEYQQPGFQSSNGQGRVMRMQNRLVRDINRAIASGADVHEATTFENRGLQALQNGDTSDAIKEFRGAEMALGNDSRNEQPFMNTASNGEPGFNSENYSGSGWNQAWQLRRDIDQAQAQGYDVTDAQYFANRGRQALDNGSQNKAMRDFNKAEAALQETGFQGVQQAYNNPNQNSNSQNQAWNSSEQSMAGTGSSQALMNSGSENNRTGWNQAQQLQRDVSRAEAQGFDVTDARHFVTQGQKALENGNMNKAAREFAAAQDLLPYSAKPGNGNSSQQAYNQRY